LTNRIVAERYARALISTISSLAEIDRISNDLNQLVQIVQHDDVFRKFFLSPRVTPSTKKDLIRKTIGDRISKNVTNLVLILIDKHRENMLIDVLERFQVLADELRGVESGTVITAIPMDDRDFNLLEETVQRFSGRQITLKREIDQSLIGGVVLWLGNHVIDGSIRYRLETIRRRLMELKPQLHTE